MSRSPRLVELLANDAAIMAFPQLQVAGALLALAAAAAAALGAGGSDTAARIRRLIGAPAPSAAPGPGAGLLTIAAQTALPLAGPAAAISGHDCPHTMTAAHATVGLSAALRPGAYPFSRQAPGKRSTGKPLARSGSIEPGAWALQHLPGVEPRRAPADGHEGQREHGDGEYRYR